MDVKIYSIPRASWYVDGDDRYLFIERYGVLPQVVDKPLPYPFINVADVYGDDVLFSFFGGNLLPFHYLRFWGSRAHAYFLDELRKALDSDIADVRGYTLSSIVFSEGKVYVLPPRKDAPFTLGEVILQLQNYLDNMTTFVGTVPENVSVNIPSLLIKKGVYRLKKPVSLGWIYGLMRKLISRGYYPVLSISPSEFMEGARFMRNLAIYMPWEGKTTPYSMIPSVAMVTTYPTSIVVGIDGMVSRVMETVGAQKVAFITVGMPRARDLVRLTEDMDVILYTDADIEGAKNADTDCKWRDDIRGDDVILTHLPSHLYATAFIEGIESGGHEDVHWLGDIRREEGDIPDYIKARLDATTLFELWEERKDIKALVLAVYKDRHFHRLVSERMYMALVESGLIHRKGFAQYLYWGILKMGISDMYHLVGDQDTEHGSCLIRIFSLIGDIYIGDLPSSDDINSILEKIDSLPFGVRMWALYLIALYISHTRWDSKFQKIHDPSMDFMYMDTYEGVDRWLFLNSKNAFAVTFMHSGDLNEAYTILSSIIPEARKYGYLDILFKVYNNLAILSGEISPRLSDRYMLLALTYALISGGSSVGGVFSSLLTEEVQRMPFRVLRRIYEVGWSISLDDIQEFTLLATWIYVLLVRGHLKDAAKYLSMLHRKYAFPTGQPLKDVEYHYLSLIYLFMKGDLGSAERHAAEAYRLIDKMPMSFYRPDIYKWLAIYYYTILDIDNLRSVYMELQRRYGGESITYLFVSALVKMAEAKISEDNTAVYSAIDILKDVYRKSLHVWKLLDAAEAAFFIGDFYCYLDKGKVATLYYRKGEVLLTRIGATTLLRYMLSRHEVCVDMNMTSNFYNRMVRFSGEARELMEEMYSLIMDLESENFFLDRVLDMFSMITDVSSLDVLLERILAEILHILPAEKGYIATVGENGLWVSYSIDGRNPLPHEFYLSPEEVVRRGGVYLTSPSAIGEVEFLGSDHLVMYLQNDTAQGAFTSLDEYFLIKLMEIIRVTVVMENLRVVSIKDKLTALYARWYGMKRGEEEFEKARRGIYPIAVLYMDLDGFKEVNDTYGHGVGDKVLTHVGNLIRRSVRYMDIPFRYGGDEFIVILPATSKEAASEVAKRIVDAVYKFFKDYPYKISISVGVASFPEDKVPSFEELLKVADDRLYKAKEMGKNRFYSGGRGKEDED